jgi:calcium-dependent protein kinase
MSYGTCERKLRSHCPLYYFDLFRAIETFELKKEIFIVMELCSGGDLYARDPYTEEEAARITSSILSAVSYMHSRKIVHRDLKYENILFVDDKPSSEIKLIDFGLSKKYGDGHLTEGVGTIYTMSPEVLKGKYNEKADMWSIGVIAYMLLSSQLPFYGKKKKQIVKQIMSGDYDFKGKKWKKMSQQAKDFIGDLLIFDPEERLDADTALRCSWLNRRHSATCRAPLEEEEELARASMLRYAGYSKLKKMALMVVAHKSSSEEIGILRKVFQRYDSRRDGSISLKEFSEAMQGFGHSAADLETMFNSVVSVTVRYLMTSSRVIVGRALMLWFLYNRIWMVQEGFATQSSLLPRSKHMELSARNVWQRRLIVLTATIRVISLLTT